MSSTGPEPKAWNPRDLIHEIENKLMEDGGRGIIGAPAKHIVLIKKTQAARKALEAIETMRERRPNGLRGKISDLMNRKKHAELARTVADCFKSSGEAFVQGGTGWATHLPREAREIKGIGNQAISMGIAITSAIVANERKTFAMERKAQSEKGGRG